MTAAEVLAVPQVAAVAVTLTGAEVVVPATRRAAAAVAEKAQLAEMAGPELAAAEAVSEAQGATGGTVMLKFAYSEVHHAGRQLPLPKAPILSEAA